MVDVREISETDVEAARGLHERFTEQAVSPAAFRDRYAEHPGLFVGAYESGSLVGICVGWRHEDGVVELAGLGVEPSHRRQGIGSRLVDAFEANAAEAGFERVTVGSAGGYVDEFYRALGYSPRDLLVRTDPADVPADYDDRFDVRSETEEGGIRKLSLAVDELDPGFREHVRDVFDDDEAIYIMEKELR